MRIFNRKLRAWMIIAVDGPEHVIGTGWGVAAKTKNDAKRIGYQLFDGEVSIRRIKAFDVSEKTGPVPVTEAGKLPDMWALEHRIYNRLEDERCPACGAERVTVYRDRDEEVVCERCDTEGEVTAHERPGIPGR